MLGKDCEEGELHPPIAFAEGMYGIELCKKVRGLFDKLSCVKASEVFVCRQATKKPAHFAVDVLGVAELAASFGHAHRPILPAQA